jgi:hypothetical protein
MDRTHSHINPATLLFYPASLQAVSASLWLNRILKHDPELATRIRPKEVQRQCPPTGTIPSLLHLPRTINDVTAIAAQKSMNPHY